MLTRHFRIFALLLLLGASGAEARGFFDWGRSEDSATIAAASLPPEAREALGLIRQVRPLPLPARRHHLPEQGKASALNLRRIIAAGRLPGYRDVKDVMSPELYAKRVVWGDIPDPVLRFQLAQGFHYCGVIHNYLPEGAPSCGHAALIVWLNPRYAAPRPAALARKAAA